MFLGLLKYYRQVYVDLVHNAEGSRTETTSMHTMVDRFFDRVEIGFLMEWTGQDVDTAMVDLQGRNRDLANEKNRYLTVFESLKTPALLLDDEDRIGNLNWAAARLLGEDSLPGATYYQAGEDGGKLSGMGPSRVSTEGPPQVGEPVQHRFPWLMDTLAVFKASQGPHMTVRKEVETAEGLSVLEVTLSKMPDVSGKFSGTVVVMEDVTFKTKVDREKESLIGELRAALKTVKTLKGLIPICSACKSVRDDQGFWEEIELYITTHSDAQLTHGICPECARKLYGIEV
jgi:PAS domain-containing protein